MTGLVFSAFSVVSPIGAGQQETLANLRMGHSGLTAKPLIPLPIAAYSGQVDGLTDSVLPDPWSAYDCRNHRLALRALLQDDLMDAVEGAKRRYHPSRIGLFLGTSTSGILETEQAYRHRDPVTGALPKTLHYAETHNTYALGRFVREFLGLQGPSYVISTACAASAKAFASAARMIDAGVCDAALVGGVDTLCGTTLFGFHALGVIAEGPCRPFDAERNGISIGEGAGFVLLERPHGGHHDRSIRLLGVGESSDAYHMSSPHPQGEGARKAMENALHAAGLCAEEIDYINLHGTATIIGDAAEDKAVSSLFGKTVPCSSSKGFTGHTLGASGVLGVIFGALALRAQFIPGSPHTRTIDPDFVINYQRIGQTASVRHVLCNTFGFGGVNCSVILGQAGE
ncbi:beta-ketoacyl-[acyl-carrier-protein] synthase family protein [Acidithiobacillus sp. AMEEHan]|uniref:beta-ketoacyl-[acyl-carrier-protein] synthase family protein n=1 Tax=Acidithiobacillus sp. AMEEHan TaxID=2994951 RepID=UPI0027E4B5C7|nr:beta-ketoacyl-[acyl-carrier-protein] synthase family protein [Acidithiobacillus sp. AMEEHan]